MVGERVPDLAELTELARLHSPLRAHVAGEYPTLANNSEAAVRDALATGHTDVVCPTPLITMLTAIRLADTEEMTLRHDRIEDPSSHTTQGQNSRG
ncbi:pyruvate phosphate dikinase domain protein [Mycobacterium xenopi 4042]|uniref:Pyruvate phosphate dikinase domain protein n=1 Tax=Mycobacterium xenopi 4042 TaxID=1299334 RepID=X8AHC1_MYCXE|nr:pyruvate phosphate dikinase domain protein [Mycobacterium xenopi 4042]